MKIKAVSSFHHLILFLLISCSYFRYYYSEGCHEEERRALLQIKDSINKTESYKLSTWVGKNCCTWYGIDCNNSTSRVEHLDLMDVRQGDANAWYLNWTLLSNLNELRWLDLSLNKLDGNGRDTLQSLGSLKELRHFNLSQNEMGGNGEELLQVVCQFNLLEHLDVRHNSLEGVVPPCLGNLTSLTFLALTYNQFQGNIPSLNRLNALEALSMSHNQFQGSILHLFGENHPIRMRETSNFSNVTVSSPWKKLQMLGLGYNELTGDGWDLAQVVCRLSLLEKLIVHFNLLEGVVPPCLDNLTSLKTLDLSHNKFKGNIPSLSRLNALESLDLSNNQFQGNILHLFGENHQIRMRDASNFSNATISPPWKKLNYLDLGNNYELTGDGSDLAQVVCHLSLIENLNVASNSLKGVVPPCLENLTSLKILDMSHNQFQGNIPSLNRLNALQNIVMSNNQFQGNILHLFGQKQPINFTISPPWKKLQFLDLRYNELTGDGWDLSQAICPLKSLTKLALDHNLLEGKLHPCLGMMHSISFLSLSYNRFQGNVPPISDGFNMNKSSLVYLDLSNNRLEGDILPRDSNMSELRVLMLQNNRFTRLTTLPRHLILVDLRHNHLSGDIYSVLLPLPHLRALLFGGNYLEGKIPKQLCEMKFLQFIDLSDNNLSGKIPSCLNNLSSMRDKYLLSNEGSIEIGVGLAPITPVDIYDNASYVNVTVGFTTKGISYTFEGVPLTLFTGIDLSCNQFIGGIPSEIGGLRNLHALNLSNNHLVGSLPTSFQNMENIESLDLSYNKLSGALPLQLTELYTLAIFNVSFNNLSGSIPFNQQFSTFKDDSFMGNVGLCGPQIKIKCSNNTTLGHNPPQPNFDDEDGAASLIENRLFFYSWVAISYALGFLVVIGLLIFSKNRRQKYFRTIDEYIYTSQEKFWILLNYFKVFN